jgi:hypothetical protein
MGGEAVDQARKTLAMDMMPLVKDHFVSRWEHQLLKADLAIEKSRP